MYLDSKRGHSHDVRCMEVLRSRSGDRFLLSGGNDAQLLVHSVRAFSQVLPPSCPSACSPRPVALASRQPWIPSGDHHHICSTPSLL